MPMDELSIRQRRDLNATPTDHFRGISDAGDLYEYRCGLFAFGFCSKAYHNRAAAQRCADPSDQKPLHAILRHSDW